MLNILVFVPKRDMLLNGVIYQLRMVFVELCSYGTMRRGLISPAPARQNTALRVLRHE